MGGTASLDEKMGTSFNALYLAERVPMVRLATLLLQSSMLAEEVVQEAFVVVSDRWDTLERPGGYLRTTVVNGCRGVLRRQDVERRHLVASQAQAEADATVTLPAHLVELHEVLGLLNERQRTVIVLRYFADMADPDIAETMGMSPVTVRTISHRALSILREALS
jgi:RNA polymerase sigma factor (sigma-70 family)